MGWRQFCRPSFEVAGSLNVAPGKGNSVDRRKASSDGIGAFPANEFDKEYDY